MFALPFIHPKDVFSLSSSSNSGGNMAFIGSTASIYQRFTVTMRYMHLGFILDFEPAYLPIFVCCFLTGFSFSMLFLPFGKQSSVMRMMAKEAITPQSFWHAAWYFAAVVSQGLFFPVVFVLIYAFPCQSVDVPRTSEAASNTTSSTMMIVSGNVCLSAFHVIYMAIAAASLPIFFFMSLRLRRIRGDIDRVMVDDFDAPDTLESLERVAALYASKEDGLTVSIDITATRSLYDRSSPTDNEKELRKGGIASPRGAKGEEEEEAEMIKMKQRVLNPLPRLPIRSTSHFFDWSQDYYDETESLGKELPFAFFTALKPTQYDFILRDVVAFWRVPTRMLQELAVSVAVPVLIMLSVAQVPLLIWSIIVAVVSVVYLGAQLLWPVYFSPFVNRLKIAMMLGVALEHCAFAGLCIQVGPIAC